MENSDLIAGLALLLSVGIIIKDVIVFIVYRQKKVAVSIDYDFQSDRLEGIVITSISQKPIVIDGYSISKTRLTNNNEKEDTDFGSLDTFIYKKLNHYESYRINVGEEYGIRFKQDVKFYLELHFLGSDKSKMLKLN
ncbi:hypothetical protein [Chryseobacterium polytrichastri]|uniref:Uncharacterized protein n=1 Tax=Chryseobacterium polytrichastri TaxID=1302687 RepID=A0A1M6VSQ4_9FLAO|nr:hypothetical protein [Chryseobacterium polytrichastri]SHK84296.1 hypothetical protein SAMN05444267_1008127 [Chryseobacterium polytrichastri]